ncbi:MAG: hypothetical protein HFJ05_00515 [Eubacterium sp.]|nr:hypothetical protein [Eubacterium sp.]
MEPPKRLITKILEFAFMLAVSAFLINLAAYWILEVWPVLLAIALIIIISIIIYRIWKHKHDSGLW